MGAESSGRIGRIIVHPSNPDIVFRTTPPDNPHIWEEPRFKAKETRSASTGASSRRR